MPFVDADSFTTIADVQGHVQRGAFSVSSRPTADEVQKFMHDRAMEIQSKLAESGYPHTIPSGGAPLPSASDVEKAIKDLANAANALLAAGDSIRAHQIRDDDVVGETWTSFHESGYKTLDALVAMIASQKTGISSGRLGTATGGIAPESFSETGFDKERKRSELFGLDTKW